MTFSVIEGREPLLAELIALAVESAGHRCLVFTDIEQATRVLQVTHVDAIVLDMGLPTWSGVKWLEAMVAICPDLPSRTLLLARTELTSREAERIRKLGAEVALRPCSILGVELIVMDRLSKVGSRPRAGFVRSWEQQLPLKMLN